MSITTKGNKTDEYTKKLKWNNFKVEQDQNKTSINTNKTKQIDNNRNRNKHKTHQEYFWIQLSLSYKTSQYNSNYRGTNTTIDNEDNKVTQITTTQHRSARKEQNNSNDQAQCEKSTNQQHILIRSNTNTYNTVSKIPNHRIKQ